MPKDNRGNPEIKNHGFKTDRDKPLTEYVHLRVTKEMKEAIQQQDDPPEFCREAIQEKLDKQKQQGTG
ncbi:hypothetical protein BCD64_10425 [Nostoc sp. MBR 210]|uniref:hypothetical protein n=1 Tax=Nostocales TaxID=1161 RepID=UPI00081E019D|nr:MULTISPECIES: hypothetical protein [Nostocales]MBD2299453.1 hypothetical protein [Nostoc sp. FACHB-190]MBD2490652.1 hypothetical protein [Aulosira sp. FACHB-615]OCQ99465.1 hypothetical protein BCD64_10425 [Nostoc sp. MBR 210]